MSVCAYVAYRGRGCTCRQAPQIVWLFGDVGEDRVHAVVGLASSLGNRLEPRLLDLMPRARTCTWLACLVDAYALLIACMVSSLMSSDLKPDWISTE